MDLKKPYSLLEDHSPQSSNSNYPTFRSSPPLFRHGCLLTDGGDGGSLTSTSPLSQKLTDFDQDLDQDLNEQPMLSCVYVLPKENYQRLTGLILHRSQETSQEDCARHRFIVWAAVKRNESLRKHPEKKTECPLLKCNHKFTDHESMLKHLARCRYLASGEYWCYNHMRVEHFDDIRCKKCLGHPSRAKKVLTIAKKLFHGLGHKSKKGQQSSIIDEEPLRQPPPSYESISRPPLGPPLPGNAAELPLTEILEADSNEIEAPIVPPQQQHPTIDPQDLLIPQPIISPSLPELDATTMEWDHTLDIPMPQLPLQMPIGLQDDGMQQFTCNKPALQLATNNPYARYQVAPRPVSRPTSTAPRSKGLSPSSSVRSTASTDTTISNVSNDSNVSYDSTFSNLTTDSHDTTNSHDTVYSNTNSLISPISNCSGAWSTPDGMNTNMTSPIDGVMLENPFADSGYSYGGCPDFLHNFYSELPADFPVSSMMDGIIPDPLLALNELPMTLDHAPETSMASHMAELPDNKEIEVPQTDLCCSETRSIVDSAWEVLQEQVVQSMVKIQDIQGNPLARQLKSMSIQTIAERGLRTLRSYLDGYHPSTPDDALCLAHLVFAFALVVYQEGTHQRVKGLYLQSLPLMALLSQQDKQDYQQLADFIWKPDDLASSDAQQKLDTFRNMYPNSKGKSPVGHHGMGSQPPDTFLAAARDFLDAANMSLELEVKMLLGADSHLHGLEQSALLVKHFQDANMGAVNPALLQTMKPVLERIAQTFDNPELRENLEKIFRGLSTGRISSIRKIEIELLHAGQNSLPSSRYYDAFVPQTRKLCDDIYRLHDPQMGISRRNDYYKLGIAYIERLLPDLDNFSAPSSRPSSPDAMDDYLNLSSSPVPTKPTPRSRSISPQPPDDSDQQIAVEADSKCDECGYRPKGHPKWFKGSMAKHKRLKHSREPPKIYQCPYPGCTSQYKNRPDNLRQHQIEKRHFLEGEEVLMKRPSKRKRVEGREEGGGRE
ncbi:hypothetical protein QBC36DRAFT_313333 [Triangularia setosa]|uniref:Uncharacterized protein n=1 Tax=Triangularia setosa TaxID=2587417 RepID=A0AAN7A5I4_9PEZI|nr:hypothetical protein QBC36DRAFT_313333 [Podospora setosa]